MTRNEQVVNENRKWIENKKQRHKDKGGIFAYIARKIPDGICKYIYIYIGK